MPLNKKSFRLFLLWVFASVFIGAVIGFGVGLTNDRLTSSILLGIGIGFILGLVLAVQSQANR